MNGLSENNNILDLLSSQGTFQVSLVPTLWSFLLCIIMSFILREVYIRRSFSLTGKSHIGSIIPILSATVFLVIVIVKSSLALSLGLVGALSIVRFRTPIKEPEELVYLFLAIAIGLGYASGQVLITSILMLLIISLIYIWLSNRKISVNNEFNLIINWSEKSLTYESIIKNISEISDSIKVVRFDSGHDDSSAVLIVTPNKVNFIDLVSEKLKDIDPKIHISFFESKTNW
tara:strand:+ start:65 stop:757 length:693 start_codon:yes stop_codon:yes gene_type:complete